MPVESFVKALLDAGSTPAASTSIG